MYKGFMLKIFCRQKPVCLHFGGVLLSFLRDVPRCKIFGEFTPEQQQEYFSLAQNKVIHNIDTLYYSVFLDEILDKLQIDLMVSKMLEMKKQLQEDRSLECEVAGLTLLLKNHAIYGLCFRLENSFDVWVSHYLPNGHTPRIQVHLRSVALWLDGSQALVKSSYEHLERFLAVFKVTAKRTQENRIDYAFHTNSIQNPYKYFEHRSLKKNLNSSFKIYHMVGEIGEDMTIDYLSLGMRTSNCLFFRAYNKTREVIEKNYKGFFIDYWYQAKLINSFDKYCFEHAYKKGSYNGLIEARCLWYLEHGTNPELKKNIAHLVGMCVHDSDNYKYLEQQIKGVIPEVTVIMNIEYQTMRKFYASFDDSIKEWEFFGENGVKMDELHPLRRLYTLIQNRRAVIDYLTTHTVSFNGAWWQRVQSCKIDNQFDSSFVRKYMTNLDRDKVHKNFLKCVATLSIYDKKCNDDDLNDDFANAVSYLNDNDMCGKGVFIDTETGEQINFRDKHYDNIKHKKNKILKSIIDN